MQDEGTLIANGYVQHLSPRDLQVLAAALPASGLDEMAYRADPATVLRIRPTMIDQLLSDPRSFEAIFDPDPETDPFITTSPFLVFAVAIHRAAAELAGATFVTEWLGLRQRIPVFDVNDLRGFLADPWKRLFLAELLASYTHVSSGSVVVPTRRGMRRQRFSELDPVRMASLIDVVSEAERPGVYRRLGDLALFLTGVFPDHTARQGFGPVEEGRLLRSGRLSRRDGDAGAIPGLGDAGAVGLLEELGRRWYRLAYQSMPVPIPAGLEVIGELSERFSEARRILNLVTDRFLFQFRTRWFGTGDPR